MLTPGEVMQNGAKEAFCEAGEMCSGSCSFVGLCDVVVVGRGRSIIAAATSSPHPLLPRVLLQTGEIGRVISSRRKRTDGSSAGRGGRGG